MKYIIASTNVTDEIRSSDNKNIAVMAGGAGAYALCGVKLWSDDAMIVTGVGSDFDSLFGEWYRKNGLSVNGLIVKDKKTPHNIIQYDKDGERTETSLYGAGHYQKIETVPEELEPYFKEAAGIYIFKNSNEEYWRKIISYKMSSQTKVMWEIGSDAAFSENYSGVKHIAQYVDIFSVNISESKALLGKETLEEIIEEYRLWNVPLIFLRRGEKGSVMITSDSADYIPSVKNVCVVDPTGGGNASSGAVLYGFCEGYTPEQCGFMGSISAAMCISQYGIPERITLSMRREAEEQLKAWGKEDVE